MSVPPHQPRLVPRKAGGHGQRSNVTRSVRRLTKPLCRASQSTVGHSEGTPVNSALLVDTSVSAKRVVNTPFSAPLVG